jgi:hypothetical protein
VLAEGRDDCRRTHPHLNPQLHETLPEVLLDGVGSSADKAALDLR